MEPLKSQEELRQLLHALQQGQFSQPEMYKALVAFGRYNFREARAEVEQLLTHEDAEIRYTALNVLAFDWVLKEHWRTALDVLRHDPDDDNRLQAANALGALRNDTQDRDLLKELAQVVRNEQDDPFVRKAAYRAMKAILHWTLSEQFPRERKPLDLSTDIDWKFVDEYL